MQKNSLMGIAELFSSLLTFLFLYFLLVFLSVTHPHPRKSNVLNVPLNSDSSHDPEP